MPDLSYRALLTAFAAEVLVDILVAQMVFGVFAGERLAPDMTREELAAVVKVVYETTSYTQWMFMFGMGTTIAGAYLAARLAKRIPYYHGLAMGVIGLVFIVLFWQGAGWMDWLAVLLTVPLSLLGGHIARQRMRTLGIL